MKNSNKRIYQISPHWNMVVLFLVCAMLFSLFVKYGVESRLAVFAHFHKPAIILSCVCAILSTASYSFYLDRLEIKILLFSIRRIYWKDVTGAMYFKTLSGKSTVRRYQPYLIICILPCRPVDPLTVNFAEFDRKNARHLVRIPISKIESEVLAVMEQLNICILGVSGI